MEWKIFSYPFDPEISYFFPLPQIDTDEMVETLNSTGITRKNTWINLLNHDNTEWKLKRFGSFIGDPGLVMI